VSSSARALLLFGCLVAGCGGRAASVLESDLREARPSTSDAIPVPTCARFGLFSACCFELDRLHTLEGVTDAEAADLDGDGLTDLAAVSHDVARVALLANDAGRLAARGEIAVGDEPWALDAVDLTADGRLDLAVSHVPGAGPGRVSLLAGDARFGFVATAAREVGGSPYALDSADVDPAPGPELVVASHATASVTVLGGGAGLEARATLAIGSAPTALALADVDGDGLVDAGVVGEAGDAAQGRVWVLRGSAAEGLQPFVSVEAGLQPNAAAAGDLDGDGHPDLVVANDAEQGGVTALRGRADGSFEHVVTVAVGEYPHAVALADLDADGLLDAVAASGAATRLVVLRGRGDGRFDPPVGLELGWTGATDVVAADFDLDGRADLAAVGYDGSLAVLRSAGR
jgi:hypothetical protein